MLNVFLDTNIYIRLFTLPAEDLDRLRELKELIEKGGARLWITPQLVDEYVRKRDVALGEKLDQLAKTENWHDFPIFMQPYDEVDELRTLKQRYTDVKNELLRKARDDAKNRSTAADKLISEIFSVASHIHYETEFFSSASQRVAKGNPPGKKNSMGDALHWEALLHSVPNDNDLYLVSTDGDFGSHLDKTQIRPFLANEWGKKQSRTGSKPNVFFYRQLTDFLSEKVPQIQLTVDRKRTEAVAALVDSENWRDTHAALKRLYTVYEYSDEDIERIAQAGIDNWEIRGILSDSDVADFYDWVISKFPNQVGRKRAILLRAYMAGEDPEQDEDLYADYFLRS